MSSGEIMKEESYNMAEIWQYPMNRENESSLRRGSFGSTLTRFEETNRDISGNNDQMGSDQRLAHAAMATIGVGTRKRSEMIDESAKVVVPTCSGNGLDDKGGKRLKTSGTRRENREAETNSGKQLEQNKEPPEPPKDYIHVRARRGQATDSHSLAERARRERISERMKILQDIVPGCNKVMGKALVLDEIINYIQSLQHQVEFLSMKLEAVDRRMNSDVDIFPPKDFGEQTFETADVTLGSQSTRDYNGGMSPEWLHMQIGGNFERTT